MVRKQFTFYKSFHDAIQLIPGKAQRANAYDAICDYGLYGIEPDWDNMDSRVRLALTVCIPVLASGRQKAQAGQKGGSAPRGQDSYTPKAQEETQKQYQPPRPEKKIPCGAKGELGPEELEAIQRMLRGE